MTAPVGKGLPWPIGTLLTGRHGGDPCRRMVVGYTALGRCLTVFLDPQPWMATPVYVEAASSLTEVPRPGGTA